MTAAAGRGIIVGMTDVDGQIDRLYQGDLGAFVAARNALVKASRRADLKTLPKPSLPAWAVNQIYWHHRPLFDRLVARAEAVRKEHRLTLSNRRADVRGAEAAHREVLREALDAARQRLAEAGHPLTSATIEAVQRTLEALPSPEANGRLGKALAPAGLEALAGLSFASARPDMRIVQGGLGQEPASIGVAPDPSIAAEAQAAHDAQARAEQEARDREAAEQRRAAEAARDAAQAALDRADAAMAEAARVLEARTRERAEAADALAKATRALR